MAKDWMPGHLGNKAGFTLIEVIAVLVILGILAAVEVPKFFDMQEMPVKRDLLVVLQY